MSATIKPDLRSHIAAISAVSSAGAAVEIDRNTQAAVLPRIMISRRNYDAFQTLGVDDDSLVREQFAIDVRGATSQKAETLADAIADDLQALRGALGDDREIKDTSISQSDDYEPNEYGGDNGESVVSILVTVLHSPQ